MKQEKRTTREYLTMLKAYGAKLLDLNVDQLVESLPESVGRELALNEAKITMMTALLENTDQGDAIIVRELAPGNYELIKGGVILMAMKNIGHTDVTAVIIKCSDERIEDIKKMCSINEGPYPISYVIKHFNEIKNIVKGTLVEQKKAGIIDSYDTNETIAEVMGISKTYVKELNHKLEEDGNSEEDGDSAEVEPEGTMNAFINPKPIKQPNEKVASSVKLHCSRDHQKLEDGFCADCPAKEKYDELLRELQNLHQLQIELRTHNRAA